MRYVILLCVAACSANVAPEPPADPCAAPDFAGPGCFDPGGGVRRCWLDDGTFWDQQPSGNQVHWRVSSVNPTAVELICEVKP